MDPSSSTPTTDASPVAVAPPGQPSSSKSASSMSKGRSKNTTKTSKALLASEFTTDSPSPAILTSATAAPRAKPAIAPFAPNSSLLSRLDAFLPQLQQANTSLFAAMAKENGDEERKRKFDIETVSPGQDKVIEMKLGLGLFEARKPSCASHEVALSLPSSGPSSATPAISLVTPTAGSNGSCCSAHEAPRIYSAGDMDVDTSSSEDDEDDNDSEDESDDKMSGEEAITADSLEEMVMRFYNEPLGEGDIEEDQGDEDQEGESDQEEEGGSRTKTPLVEEMMEGVEATSPSPQR